MTNGIGRVGWRSFVPTNNPLWDNLKAYFTADNTPNDAKGTNNGVLTNGATYSTGKIGSGFSLDGINDFILVSPAFGSNFFTNTSIHSYSAWVYPKTVTSNAFIVQGGQSDNGTSLALSTNKVRFWFNGGNNAVDSNGTVLANTWNHVLVSYNGAGAVSFYINGVFDSTKSASFVNSVSSNIIRIGAYQGGLLYFNGVIDELGVWSRALTATEVTELYNAGAGKQYVAPTPVYTTRTAAFATATGITDTTILNALNTFDTGLISNGLATKMKALYPFVGGTSNTHKFNFMDARDVDAAFRLAFNGGWVHSSTGALPNGTNGYADTNFKPSNSTYTNFGWGFYLTTNSVGVYNEFGFWAPGQVVYGYPNLDGSFYIKYGGGDLDGSGGNTIGFHSYNQSSNQMKRFKNGILTHTFPNVPSNLSLANVSYFIAARNNSGTGGQFSNRSRTFQYISDGLTDSEATTLYTLVQSMQTNLSRQV
jgi:hypothetical protein